MPYQPQPGGYNWRAKTAEGRQLVRHQRELIEHLVQGGASQTELFQTLSGILLTNSSIDDVLADLSAYRGEERVS